MLGHQVIKKFCRIFLIFDVVVMLAVAYNVWAKQQDMYTALLECVAIVVLAVLYWIFVWNILPDEHYIEKKLRKNEKLLLLFVLLIKGLMYAGLVGFHFVSQNNTYVVLGVVECVLLILDIVMNFVMSKCLTIVNQRETPGVEKTEMAHSAKSESKLLFVYGIAVLYMILSLGQLFVYCMEHVSITCMMLRALGLGIVLDQYGKDVTDQKTPFKGRMKICTLIALFVIELLAVLLKLNLAPVSYITYVCAFVCMISMILFEVFLCGPIGKQYHDQKQVSGGNGNR